MPPLEVLPRNIPTNRRTGPEEMNPLLPIERQYRPGDVTGPGRLPEYNRPIDRPYPVSPRKRSEFTESAGFEYYEGNAPGHEQAFACVYSLNFTIAIAPYACSALILVFSMQPNISPPLPLRLSDALVQYFTCTNISKQFSFLFSRRPRVQQQNGQNFQRVQLK